MFHPHLILCFIHTLFDLSLIYVSLMPYNVHLSSFICTTCLVKSISQLCGLRKKVGKSKYEIREAGSSLFVASVPTESPSARLNGAAFSGTLQVPSCRSTTHLTIGDGDRPTQLFTWTKCIEKLEIEFETLKSNLPLFRL